MKEVYLLTCLKYVHNMSTLFRRIKCIPVHRYIKKTEDTPKINGLTKASKTMLIPLHLNRRWNIGVEEAEPKDVQTQKDRSPFKRQILCC